VIKCFLIIVAAAIIVADAVEDIVVVVTVMTSMNLTNSMNIKNLILDSFLLVKIEAEIKIRKSQKNAPNDIRKIMYSQINSTKTNQKNEKQTNKR